MPECTYADPRCATTDDCWCGAEPRQKESRYKPTQWTWASGYPANPLTTTVDAADITALFGLEDGDLFEEVEEDEDD